MSSSILRALMQLFAIIARPESNVSNRRTIVEVFLKQKLNSVVAKEYIQIYDEYYRLSIEKHSGSKKKEKILSHDSVKVLKICTDINKELTQLQKVMLLFSLWEFAKAGKAEISDQEKDFINTISDSFNLSPKDSMAIRDFAISDFDKIKPHSEMLYVSGNQPDSDIFALQQHWPNLDGTIKMLQIVNADLFIFRYYGSNELYLNGHIIPHNSCIILTPGATIRDSKIEAIYYSEIINAFRKNEIEDAIVLRAEDISYTYPGSKAGIRKMNIEAQSGRMVGIIGASGTGKSTLMNILSGSLVPDTGKVMLNNVDIASGKDISGIIGFVSQDDFLFEDLSVFQNLFYNAKLCFKDLSDERLTQLCLDTLSSIELDDVADLKVGSPLDKKISGGERKRLNIAMELIRKPDILFLDEPTSGLSSRDSENIMDLLKELSFAGKLIITVIHQPSSGIFKMFDNLIVLDKEGYLIYYGNPIDSLIYFKSHILHADWKESECSVCGNVNHERIFDIVEAKIIDEFGRTTNTRKISAWEWNQYYKSHEEHNVIKVCCPDSLPKSKLNSPGWFRQFWVFVTRDFYSKLARKQYLVINLFEAPLLALLLSFIVKSGALDERVMGKYIYRENDNLPVYLFMAVIIAIFIGLTVSSEEIIKDRKIRKRESFLNLSWSSYLSSKIFILFILSAIQSLSFVLIANFVLEIKGMLFYHWIILFSIWCLGILSGLIISDGLKTTINVYILIPFLIIPQIVLGGAFITYDKMNPAISSHDKVPWFGEMTFSRWGFEALAVKQFLGNNFQKEMVFYDIAKSKANYKKNYWIPELQEKLRLLTILDKNHDKKDESDMVFRLIRSEIEKESKTNSRLHFIASSSMEDKNYFKSEAGKYLESLYSFYDKLYKLASTKQDNYINLRQNSATGRAEFRKNKDEYFNEALSDMLRRTNSQTRILCTGKEMIQKIDPVFKLPGHDFIRSHFYAPKKYLFGKYYNTYWVNVAVMWLFGIIIYIALYFRWLKYALLMSSSFRNRLFHKTKNDIG
ncbi:MAG: ATP-binding cassette domain-containing protein [Bacteroidota bacterium]|nr:ATP-binding cassette domain-containing protein [Bacteroidota bacterium]